MEVENDTPSDPVIPAYIVYEHMLDRQVDTRHPCVVLDKPPFRMACGNVLVAPDKPRVRVDFFHPKQQENWWCPAENYEYFSICYLKFIYGPLLMDVRIVAIGFAVAEEDRQPEPEDVDLFRRALAGEMAWRSKKEDMKKIAYWDDCDGTPPYVDPRAAVQKEWKERYGDSK